MPVRTPLCPGRQTPMRSVPAHILRPEYVGKAAPTPSTDPWTQP
ncbi:MAG TPA: type I methionyl aminopeptidase, partial [Pseudonocardiaceae bacterium]